MPPTLMRFRQWQSSLWLNVCLVAASGWFVAACATRDHRQADGAAYNPAALPEPYVRVQTSSSNRIELQIAARQFVPAHGRGPTIWLVGVSHIGEANYYAALQQHLDAQSLVLFEGVKDGPSGASPRGAAPTHDSGTEQSAAAASRAGNRGSLQAALASSLGLVFQLEAINYASPQFQNSDLSVDELRALMEAQPGASGRNGSVESFETLLQMMEGSSMWDVLLQGALRLLGASPKWQGLGRLVLIDTLGPIQGDPSQLQGLPPDLKALLQVLLERRNQKVVEDLAVELKDLGKQDSVAVFYGTGHMPDLEQRLRRELRYRPIGQLWLTAFSVDPVRAGISESERQFLRNLVQTHLQGKAQP
jgi:hypothetical protein